MKDFFKGLFKNATQLKTTIAGLMLAIPAVIYGFTTWDWNEYVIEAIIAGLVSIVLPDFFTDSERSAIRTRFKKMKSDAKRGIKFIGLLIMFSVCHHVSGQNDETVDQLRVRELVTLSSLCNDNPVFCNDTTLALHFGYNGDSLITVNDTLLTDWISKHGGNVSDSSWTSIKVDTINSFTNPSNIIYINGSLRNINSTAVNTIGGLELFSSKLQSQGDVTNNTYIQMPSNSLFLRSQTDIRLQTQGGDIELVPQGAGIISPNADFVPSVSSTLDLGSISNPFDTLFVDDIQLTSSTIAGTDVIISGENSLALSSPTGNVQIEDLTIQNNNISNESLIDPGVVDIENLKVQGNVLTTSSGSLILRSTGSSEIQIGENFVPELGSTYDLGSSSNPFDSIFVDHISGGVTFGTNDQIPFMNLGSNDFEYNSEFTYNGSTFTTNDFSFSNASTINHTDAGTMSIVNTNGGITLNADTDLLFTSGSSGDFYPNGSGVNNLGKSSNTWSRLYANNITMGAGEILMTTNGNIITGDIQSAGADLTIEGFTFNGRAITATNNGFTKISTQAGDSIQIGDGANNVQIGNYKFNSDQTVTQSQDGYALIYDDPTRSIQLQQSGANNIEFTPTKVDSSNVDNFSVTQFYYNVDNNYVIAHLQGSINTTASGTATITITLPITPGSPGDGIGHGSSNVHGSIFVLPVSGDAQIRFPYNTSGDQNGFSLTIAYRGS